MVKKNGYMFRKNTKHNQSEMFGFFEYINDSMKKELLNSQEKSIYELIYCNIKEEDFSILYSEEKSRPNAPINAMVTALILMDKHGWTFEDLFNQMRFNLLTKMAFGMKHLDEKLFCSSTLFLFLKQVNEYYTETGVHLFEKVFENFTDEQKRALKIKTNIQRTDSLLIGSNIRNYTRLELMVEVLIRLHRILTEEDKKKYEDIFKPYVEKTSANFIYKVRHTEAYEKMQQLAIVYDSLYGKLIMDYSEQAAFKIFERVYKEQFIKEEEKIQVLASEKVQSSSLQSPDDLEATYHNKKNKKGSKGQTINVVETANPENPIELITDISVHANNIDDSKALNERIEIIKEKTPDLEEIHQDGGYGSRENDEKLEESGIVPIQTAIKGIQRELDFKIEELKENESYRVSCPKQAVISQATQIRHKAVFDKEICSNCEHIDSCPVRTLNKVEKVRVYYFKREDFLRNRRNNNIKKIPKERRSLRANVEATMREFARGRINGKIKLRGDFKAALYALLRGISINFGRVYRYRLQFT